MEDETLFEGKVVEINDKLNYYIIKQTIYNDSIYLFGNELIDDETPSENVAILKVENKPEGLFVRYENDENLQQALLAIFSEMLKNTETED